ncbi:MAG: TlpA disulfide reductase family protein [Bacteroidota bacterium]
MDKKKKRELIGWILLTVVTSSIYLGDWHKQIIGKLQQVVLSTGIIGPNKLEKVRKAAYDFTIKDEMGNLIPFESFKGKVVFMNFWASWCPPCIAEMPNIDKLYQITADSIAYVMISLDKEPQEALKYVEKKGFNFPIYFLNSHLPNNYNVRSIPTTYVLSNDGFIVAENHGMAKYNSENFRTFLSDLLKSQ